MTRFGGSFVGRWFVDWFVSAASMDLYYISEERSRVGFGGAVRLLWIFGAGSWLGVAIAGYLVERGVGDLGPVERRGCFWWIEVWVGAY